jgi:hypothetical protein
MPGLRSTSKQEHGFHTLRLNVDLGHFPSFRTRECDASSPLVEDIILPRVKTPLLHYLALPEKPFKGKLTHSLPVLSGDYLLLDKAKSGVIATSSTSSAALNAGGCYP